MENATKALLIAASVLIVIVLISVGIKLLSSTSDVTDQVDSVSGTMATSVFNSQFLSYVSDNTSASQAKSLVSKVIAHNSSVNSSGTFSKDKHQIWINLYPNVGSNDTHNWQTTELKTVYNKISDTSRYKISVTGCTATGCDGGYYKGYVVCISISEI